MSTGAPPDPDERLSPSVRGLWGLRYALRVLVLVVAGLIAAGPLEGTLATLAWTVPLVLGGAVAAALPGLRYRRWAFDVSAEEVDLRHGGFTVRRTLVPMRRVQHVDSSSGVLEQLFDLATVTVHTAGGTVSIPGLELDRSRALHRRVAELARLTDDD